MREKRVMMTSNYANDTNLQRIQAGVDAISEGFALFDDNDSLEFCNAAFKALYPELASFLRPGLNWQVFLIEAQRRFKSAVFKQLDNHLTSGINSPISLEAAGRGNRWMRLGIHWVHTGGFVLIQADISDQHEANEVLENADNLPSVRLDEDQMIQVFINLMINAEHALESTSEPPILKITTQYDDGNQRLIARVSDNGSGVSESLRGRIFEPFFTTKSVGEGTGMVQETTSQRQRTIRALLIEDEPDVSHVMQKLLAGIGVISVPAANAKQGLDILESDSLFDLVLCDLRMPGLNGREMLQVVENRWPLLSERFVFVTGDAISEDAEVIRQQGAHQLIEKPVSPVELKTLINSIADLPAHNTGTE